MCYLLCIQSNCSLLIPCSMLCHGIVSLICIFHIIIPPLFLWFSSCTVFVSWNGHTCSLSKLIIILSSRIYEYSDIVCPVKAHCCVDNYLDNVIAADIIIPEHFGTGTFFRYYWNLATVTIVYWDFCINLIIIPSYNQHWMWK